MSAHLSTGTPSPQRALCKQYVELTYHSSSTGQQPRGTQTWVSVQKLSLASMQSSCLFVLSFIYVPSVHVLTCGRVVEYLAGRGAAVDTVDDSGWSPLISAASAGKTETVSFVRDRSFIC